ncbi:hypothetical protein A3Q56_04142 [Intoshia linei]|uniref:Oxysterol-binding protein n=1 Tax=Intoshia linei TaxID=1819745 RepID=A0A177B1N8_9BILA|nr:hypothetical protein A3Q56_04142 [Intoshia linei]
MENLHEAYNSRPTDRNKLDTEMPPYYEMSIWKFIKSLFQNSEITKFTTPIIFNEPLTFLQRNFEIMEYENMLYKASICQDAHERMKFITSFVVSQHSYNDKRLRKCFSSVSGETFEYQSKDGWIGLAEQISHNPSKSVYHMESETYKIYGSNHTYFSFKGTHMNIKPNTRQIIYLKKFNEKYKISGITLNVRNLLYGKKWIDIYCSFSNFTLQLNRNWNELLKILPPTDSRLRKDVRYFELGQMDKSENMKSIYERNENKKHEHKLAWFIHNHKSNSDELNEPKWIIDYEYYKRNWKKCKNLFRQ